MTQILTHYIKNTDLIMTLYQLLLKKIMTLWNFLDYLTGVFILSLSLYILGCSQIMKAEPLNAKQQVRLYSIHIIYFHYNENFMMLWSLLPIHPGISMADKNLNTRHPSGFQSEESQELGDYWWKNKLQEVSRYDSKSSFFARLMCGRRIQVSNRMVP